MADAPKEFMKPQTMMLGPERASHMGTGRFANAAKEVRALFETDVIFNGGSYAHVRAAFKPQHPYIKAHFDTWCHTTYVCIELSRFLKPLEGPSSFTPFEDDARRPEVAWTPQP